MLSSSLRTKKGNLTGSLQLMELSLLPESSCKREQIFKSKKRLTLGDFRRSKLWISHSILSIIAFSLDLHAMLSLIFHQERMEALMVNSIWITSKTWSSHLRKEKPMLRNSYLKLLIRWNLLMRLNLLQSWPKHLRNMFMERFAFWVTQLAHRLLNLELVWMLACSQ